MNPGGALMEDTGPIDRIPFAAKRGLRRNYFTWRERLQARQGKRTAYFLLITVLWTAILIVSVFADGTVVDVLFGTIGDTLHIAVLVIGLLVLFVVIVNVPRTKPFSGYLDKQGLVLHVGGAETRLPWQEFSAHELAPKALSLRLRQPDLLPGLFGLRVPRAAWLPLLKSLFSSEGDWLRAVALATQELERREPSEKTEQATASDSEITADRRVAFAGELTLADLLRSYGVKWLAKWRAWRARRRIVSVLGTGFVAFVIIDVVVFAAIEPDRLATLRGCAPLLGLAAAAAAFFLLSLRAAARQSGHCSGYLASRGLYFKTAASDSFRDWPSFSGRLESRRAILLQLDPLRTLVIPRRWLDSEVDWLGALDLAKAVPLTAPRRPSPMPNHPPAPG
jgi:hypothetical protein